MYEYVICMHEKQITFCRFWLSLFCFHNLVQNVTQKKAIKRYAYYIFHTYLNSKNSTILCWTHKKYIVCKKDNKIVYDNSKKNCQHILRNISMYLQIYCEERRDYTTGFVSLHDFLHMIEYLTILNILLHIYYRILIAIFFLIFWFDVWVYS